MAVIILPFRPIAPLDMEVLPVGGIALVDLRLRNALGDLVEVIEEEMLGHREEGFDQAIHSDKVEVKARHGCEKSSITPWFHHLFLAWNRAFQESFVKTSDLLALADEAGWTGHGLKPQQRHQRVSKLGKSLIRLSSLDTRPWVMKTRVRSHRTEYALSFISDEVGDPG